MRLDGKQVVIIGGSSGIGLATARLALAEGASVTIAGRSADRLDRAVRELAGGSRVRAGVVDVPPAVAALFDRVDHLYVTAGDLVPGAGNLFETDLDSLRGVLDTRVIGPALVLRAARPKLTAASSVVLSSSRLATRPVPGFTSVSASVAAVEGMTRALALDLAPIRVNALAPGIVATPLFDSFDAEWRTRAAATGRRSPVGRVGQADGVAEAAVFLMTNGYGTGTILRVAGGGTLV